MRRAAVPRAHVAFLALVLAGWCNGDALAFDGTAVLAGATGSFAAAAENAADVEVASRRLVLVGLETGVIHVDIPHPERSGESFGTRLRLAAQVGYEIGRRFAMDGEIGFSFLGESDSLNAILVSQGRAEGAAYTLVDASLGLTGRWPLGSRWAPFARASGGLASLALSWPDGGTRSTDPLWSLGGGLEIGLARPVLLRLQGRWMGQAAGGSTQHHATAELAVFYAFYQRSFADATTPGSPR